jgi:hypothetical protein
MSQTIQVVVAFIMSQVIDAPLSNVDWLQNDVVYQTKRGYLDEQHLAVAFPRSLAPLLPSSQPLTKLQFDGKRSPTTISSPCSTEP